MSSLLSIVTVFFDVGFAPFLAFVFGAAGAFDFEVTGALDFLGDGGVELAWHLVVGTCEFDVVDCVGAALSPRLGIVFLAWHLDKMNCTHQRLKHPQLC